MRKEAQLDLMLCHCDCWRLIFVFSGGLNSLFGGLSDIHMEQS